MTFSLRETPPGEVRFKVAGLMELLDVAQLLTLDGGAGVSWSTPEK